MRLLALAALLVLGACSSDVATFSEQREMSARWEAQNIFPTNYKTDLLAYMRSYLNNPEHVRSGALAPPQLKTVGPGERYVVCVRYNARDSGGKYIGLKEGAAVYVSGRLDQFIDQPRQTQEICKGAAYVPFPEIEKLSR